MSPALVVPSQGIPAQEPSGNHIPSAPGHEKRLGKGFSLRLAGLLIFLIPWLSLLRHLESLAVEEEESLSTTYHQLAMTELEDFYRDLEPANYIQDRLEDCDRQDGLLSPSEGAVLHPPPRRDPRLFSGRFLVRRKRQLESQFGLKPLFIAVAGCDLRTVYWWADQGLQNSVERLTLAMLADAMVQQVAQPGSYWVPPASSTRKTASSRPFPPIRRRFGKDPAKEQFSYRAFSERTFGHFWNYNNLIDGGTQISFSECVGQQNLLTSSRFFYSSSHPSRSTFGGYILVCREANLPLKRIFEHALSHPNQGHLFKRVLSSPGQAQASAPTPLFSGPLPVIYAMTSGNPREKAQELGIVLSRPPGDNPYWIAHLSTFWSGVFLLGMWGSLFLAARFSSIPSIGLRWKLVATISCTIALPFLGLWLLTLKWLTGHGDDLSRRANTRMEAKTTFLAERIREWARHRHLDNLTQRSHLKDLLPLDHQGFLSRVPSTLHSFNQGDYLFVLRNDGSHKLYAGGQNKQQTDFHLALGKRLLKNLGVLQLSTSSPKDLAINDFMDFSWKINRASHQLAREGLETGYVFGLLDNQHMHFFLIPTASGTREIGGLAFLRLHYFKGFQELLDSYAVQHFSEFWDSTPSGVAHFAIIPLATIGMKGGAWPREAFHDPLLRYFFRDNARLRGSNSDQRRTTDSRLLYAGTRADPYGFLVSGVSTLPASPVPGGIAISILGFITLYAILLVLLTADLLSILLLRPIQSFIEAADSVGSGRLDVRVAQDSGDEFEEMGRAFNRMATALQQRETLRSYLPQRLIQQITSAAKEAGQLKGEEITVIILASDIRGFTSLSERISPELLVPALNDYFTLMQDAITREGGMILKLVGDAILAVFYPDPQGVLPLGNALRAARTMRSSLSSWNARRLAEGQFPFENGVGLAMGPVLSGQLGGKHGRRDFTVVGAVVGEAATLESLSVRGVSSRIIVDHLIRQSIATNEISSEIYSDGDSKAIAWEITA